MSGSLQEELLKLREPQIKELLAHINQSNVTFTFDREHERRNRDTMIKLGITDINEVYTIIKNLDYTDYSSGPESNNSPNAPKFFKDGDVWKFGKVVTRLVDVEVYIKICFKERGSAGFVACISFHEPEFSIEYPFRLHNHYITLTHSHRR